MTKIIFFDIDGTLVEFHSNEVHQRVKDALNKIHDQGVKIFLATGRPPFAVPKFEGVPVDGVLAFNGQYCSDQEGTIFSNPLNKSDIHTMISNATEMGLAVQIASKNRMGANFFQQELEDYFKVASQHCIAIDDYDELLKEDIYECMVAASPERVPELFKNTTQLKGTRWTDLAFDIIPTNGSKAVGMEHVLKHYGFKREECMAFGDGGNDKDMLGYAYIGIAMANGTDDVKAIADYITDDVKDDGVVTALEHFGLI